MSLVNEPLSALFNGVSQQPATLRLDSQLEAQVNVLGTVVDGLLKRPPTEHVSKLSATPLATTAYITTINRDITERYTVVIKSGSIQVFDIDGTEKTVNAPGGMAYLTSTDPLQDFAVVSIADYSFIINQSVEVELNAADVAQAADFADWYTPKQWYPGRSIPPNRFFNVAQGTYQGTKQVFEDLPKASGGSPPSEGDVWRIAGAGEGNFDGYYVVYRSGVWEETYEPFNGSQKIKKSTMPHALVRESDGTFTFTKFAYNPRQFGDDNTNPAPSFVGKKIRDVFYYKNRLGFVADENVIFSGAGDYGNFWRTTATQLLDSDVVDVAVSSTQVSLLKYAVPFANSLMLFADQTQFSLNVDELLTPSTVSIDPVTSYEMSTKVRPVAIGNNVYFITETGNYSRMREYFVEEGRNQTEAADVTAHVPRYLPKGIVDMAGNGNEDVLFAISNETGHRNRVYLYKFFFNADGKVQSSWSYWEFGADDVILSIADLENKLFIIIERADGVYLERIDIQSGATATGLTFNVLLDRRADITGTYAAGPVTTTFTLPYPVPAGTMRTNFKIIRGASFTGSIGSLVDPAQYTWLTDTTLEVPGDESAGDCHIGINYVSRFEFSQIFLKDGDGSAITTGRLQLRAFTIYYTDTAFFSTEVAPYGITPEIEEVVPSALSEFTGKTLGAASLLIGEPSFHTGSYTFQVYGNSTEATVALLNDTHVQSRIQSAEWEGFYFNRAS